MIEQLSELTKKVDNNVESLMKVYEIKEGGKLTDIDEKNVKFNIAPESFFRALGRIGQDYSTRTRKVLETLYAEVENTTTQILHNVHLNVVLVANKNHITATENDLYLSMKNLLMKQTDWAEKSIVGLLQLDKSYQGKDKKFVMIKEKLDILVMHVKSTVTKLDEAHKKLTTLNVLGAN